MNFRFQMLKYLIVNKQKNIVKILAFVEKCFLPSPFTFWTHLAEYK